MLQYEEYQGEVEHLIDRGEVTSSAQADDLIDGFALSTDDKNALSLWAWAWIQSKPVPQRTERLRLPALLHPFKLLDQIRSFGSYALHPFN